MPLLTFTTGYEDASVTRVIELAEKGYFLACIEIVQRSTVNQKCKDFSVQQARSAIKYILSIGNKNSLHYNIAIAFHIMISFFDEDYQKVIDLYNSIQNLSDFFLEKNASQNEKTINEINGIKNVIADFYQKATQSLQKKLAAEEKKNNIETETPETNYVKYKQLGDLSTDSKQKHKHYRLAYGYYYRAMLLTKNGIPVHLKTEIDFLKKCMATNKNLDSNLFYICYCLYQYHTIYGSEINNTVNIEEIKKILFEQNTFDTERLIQFIDYCCVNNLVPIHATSDVINKINAALHEEAASNTYYLDKLIHAGFRIALKSNNIDKARSLLKRLSDNYIQISHKDIMLAELPQQEKDHFLYECFKWYFMKIKALEKTRTDNLSTMTLKFDLPYYKSIKKTCELLIFISPEFKKYDLDEINQFITLIDVNQYPNLCTKLKLLDNITAALTSKESAGQSYSTLSSLAHLKNDLNNPLTHFKSFISTMLDNLGEFVRKTAHQNSIPSFNPLLLFSSSMLNQKQLTIISTAIEEVTQIKNEYDSKIIMPNQDSDKQPSDCSQLLEEYSKYNNILNLLANRIAHIKQMSSNEELIKICDDLLEIKTKVEQKIPNDKIPQAQAVNRQKK